METSKADPRADRLQSLLGMADRGTAAADIGRHKALLNLVLKTLPDRPLTDDECVAGLLFIFREVLTIARKSLPLLPERKRGLHKPERPKEIANTQIMAAGELLGLNDKDDDAVFEQRCKPDELDVLQRESNKFGHGVTWYRQTRAAHWLGHRSAITGKRSAKDCLERAFIPAVEAYLLSERGRERLRFFLDHAVSETTTERGAFDAASKDSTMDLEGGERPVELDDEMEEKKIKVDPKFAILAALAFLAFLLPVFLSPAFTWQPFKMAEDSARRGAWVLAVPMLLFVVILSDLLSELKIFRTVAIYAFVILLFVVSCARVVNYKFDRAEIGEISRLKSAGGLLGPREFGKINPCPTEILGNSVRSLPFSSCRSDNGFVYAQVSSVLGERIGVYATGDTKFHLAPKGATLRSGYYLDVRVRPELGPLSACGLTVESNSGFLFFHVIWDPLLERYFAEVSTVVFLDTSPSGNNNYTPQNGGPRPAFTSFIKSSDLPFVGKWTLSERENGTWTRLTVSLASKGLSMLVNGRSVLFFPYPDLADIYRGSVAVVTGTTANGGVAECVFDHAEAGILPMS